MQIYLPIAEIAVPAEAVLLLGAVVGFLSGVFGIGGGFLATPLLIFMGIPPAIAVGTQANQLIAASVSGVLGHWKRGDVDLKMGGVMMAGSVAGSVAGMLVFGLLQHVGQIDVVIPVLYVLLLGSIGALMLFESLSSIMNRRRGDAEGKAPLHSHPFFQRLPYKMRFPRSRLYVSALLPGGIGFVGGVLVAVMGIGGGFLTVPAMIYLLGMPTLLVVGTSLFQIMVTTVFVTVMHAMTSHTVDIVLAALLIAGAVVGAQAGVRFGRKVKGAYARIILAVLLLVVCVELAGGLLIRPVEMYSTDVR